MLILASIYLLAKALPDCDYAFLYHSILVLLMVALVLFLVLLFFFFFERVLHVSFLALCISSEFLFISWMTCFSLFLFGGSPCIPCDLDHGSYLKVRHWIRFHAGGLHYGVNLKILPFSNLSYK